MPLFQQKGGMDVKAAIRIISVLILIPVTYLIVMLFASTGWERIGEDVNFVADYHKWTGNVVISDYYWDGSENDLTVIVPDEVDGKKIKSLGGNFGGRPPVVFKINLPESIEKGGDRVVTVKLGKNIKNADYFVYRTQYVNKVRKVEYSVIYYYECSEDNKWIYSEDGHLYDKKTGEEIFNEYCYEISAIQ